MEPTIQVECIVPYNYLNFVVPAATIISAIIGGWWVFNINRANAIRAAKYEFIGVILTCFKDIYPAQTEPVQGALGIIGNSFATINIAIQKLRFYVNESSLSAYDRAWDEYKNWYKNKIHGEPLTTADFYNPDKSLNIEFCAHIEALLSFASMKHNNTNQHRRCAALRNLWANIQRTWLQ